MNVVINIEKNSDIEGISQFFSTFRFPNFSIAEGDPNTKSDDSQVTGQSDFCIQVLEGVDDLKAKDLEAVLSQGNCSLMIFNDIVQVLEEPKVIFATDYSDQAATNLERFKQLRPAGFVGATVISEAIPTSSEVINHEMNLNFLARTKGAAQATQANLIIANFDLRHIGQKSSQFTKITKLVLQNRCHVLILNARVQVTP